MKRLEKGKIRRNFTDFYSPEDIQEPESPVPNLNIDNFDRKGLIVNPEAPCLATTIDPDYLRDCNKPLKIRKFLIKSDILRLRNITRTKFFFYTSKERALEKEREWQNNNKVYEEIMDFYKFCFTRLSEMESAAFKQMRQKFDELQSLHQARPSDERSQLELEHQRAYVEVVDVFEKFRYLLKLIDYFDCVSEEADEIEKLNEILQREVHHFLNTIPKEHGSYEIQKITEYMETLIKPYLAKKNYLDAELWYKGYQSIRCRIFNYSRHLSRLALLNHLVKVIYDRFMEVHQQRLQQRIFFKKPEVLRTRSSYLQTQTRQLLHDWEGKYRSDLISVEIAAIIPTVARNLGLTRESNGVPSERKHSFVEGIEKIQEHLTGLLGELDLVPSQLVRRVEKSVRRKMEREKKLAKEALVKQMQMHNLLDHYRNHYRKKDIVRQYTTLIKRPRGRVLPVNKC